MDKLHSYGIPALQEGVERSLTRSDLARGYVYVSKDRRIHSALRVKDFTVLIAGTQLRGKRLSSSGRVFVPKGLLASMAERGRVVVRLVDETTISIEPARS